MPHKTIRLTIDLEMLCQIRDSRSNPDQDLDSRIEELISKGIQYEQVNKEYALLKIAYLAEAHK